ncbi:MAG: ABC transporter permease, partial [Chloroflexi bacterium]|nr:ABC transporter permease [Chloroflexota bacterium]
AFVEPSLGNMPVGGASWIVSFDETHFVPEMAEQYVKGLQRAEVEVLQMLPNVKTDVTPLPIFQAHLERQRPLTILLFGFMVPIIGFLFYFITLVSRIVMEHQRRVVATVVSRGMSREQVLQFNLYQALILFIPGTPLGIFLGLEAARLMGHTVSFLTFEPREALAVSLRSVNPGLVIATLVVALVARLWPSFREARWSMVEYVAHTVRS